jgi:hypothetical protein
VTLFRKINETVSKKPKGQSGHATSTTSDFSAVASSGLNDSERNRLLRSLVRLPMGCKFQPSLELLDPDGWVFKIDGLRRVQRIRERHSTPLLLAFMQYAARPAYPHELTKLSHPSKNR